MEVNVEIPKMRKVVRLEVEPDHSLDSILEIICRDLGLGRKESWSLVWHDVETSDYLRTIRQLGVREGDSFQLVEKARLPPQVVVPPKKIEISRRRYLKYAAASTTVVAIVAAAGYGIYEATKPPPTTPTPTPTPTPTLTLKPTYTSTPTPSSYTDLYNFRVIEEFPNSMTIEVEYSYGSDKLPSKFSERTVRIYAWVDIPDFQREYVVNGLDRYECNKETKRGTARLLVGMCRKPGSPVDITVKTTKIRVLMMVDGEPGERIDDLIFFEKTFDYFKTWSELKECLYI